MKFFSGKLLFPVVLAILLFTGVVTGQETEKQDTETAEPKPVAFTSVVRIAPENTKIEFVGTHTTKDDPKPRLGGFSTFSGVIGVNVSENKVTSIEVDIDIASIWTEFEKLTVHLANADFFETEEFPTAKFTSTSVTTLQNGTCNIVGDLTLHGTTSEIQFPANFKLSESGLVLTAQFFLDRTQFGMDQMTDGVEKMVSLNIVVGQPTKGVEAKPGHGGETDDQASNESTMTDGRTVTVKLPHML